MPRTATQAIDTAKTESDHASRDWKGYCLIFVRTCWGVPARFSDAISAWENAASKHHTDNAPVGAPVFWRVGSHGHIALSAGGGKVWSTDIRRTGKVDIVPVDEITRRWGATFLGWTEDLNGVTLFGTPAAPPAPPSVPAAAHVAAPGPAAAPSHVGPVITGLTVTQDVDGVRVQWPHVTGATGYSASFDGQHWVDLKMHNAFGGNSLAAGEPRFTGGQLVRVMARAYDAAGPGPIADVMVRIGHKAR